MKRLLVTGLLAISSISLLVSDALSQQKTPVRGGILREIWAPGPHAASFGVGADLVVDGGLTI